MWSSSPRVPLLHGVAPMLQNKVIFLYVYCRKNKCAQWVVHRFVMLKFSANLKSYFAVIKEFEIIDYL